MANNELKINQEKIDRFVELNLDLFMKRASKLSELSKQVQRIVHDVEELELDLKQLFKDFGKDDT